MHRHPLGLWRSVVAMWAPSPRLGGDGWAWAAQCSRNECGGCPADAGSGTSRNLGGCSGRLTPMQTDCFHANSVRTSFIPRSSAVCTDHCWVAVPLKPISPRTPLSKRLSGPLYQAPTRSRGARTTPPRTSLFPRSPAPSGWLCSSLLEVAKRCLSTSLHERFCAAMATILGLQRLIVNLDTYLVPHWFPVVSYCWCQGSAAHPTIQGRCPSRLSTSAWGLLVCQ